MLFNEIYFVKKVRADGLRNRMVSSDIRKKQERERENAWRRTSYTWFLLSLQLSIYTITFLKVSVIYTSVITHPITASFLRSPFHKENWSSFPRYFLKSRMIFLVGWKVFLFSCLVFDLLCWTLLCGWDLPDLNRCEGSPFLTCIESGLPLVTQSVNVISCIRYEMITDVTIVCFNILSLLIPLSVLLFNDFCLFFI